MQKNQFISPLLTTKLLSEITRKYIYIVHLKGTNGMTGLILIFVRISRALIRLIQNSGKSLEC